VNVYVLANMHVPENLDVFVGLREIEWVGLGVIPT
jgi:hypothetical protein